jgi:penicillin-binding protein 2
VSTRAAFHPYLVARRGSFARNTLLAVFGLLGLAFFRLQVLEHAHFALRSKTNRLRPVPLLAPRGLIVDRRGEVIAENVPGYAVSLLASSEDSLRAMVARIAEVIAPREVLVDRIVARFRALPYEPALVLKDAPFDVVSRLEERRPVLPGLVIQREPKRQYPDGNVVAHLVGYVGEVTEGDLASAAFAQRRSGALVGRDGLEREYEDSLAGQDGVRFVEVDALGRVVRDEGAAASLPAVPGHPLRTTIDLDLQRFVASVFPAGKRGAIVAMDPRDGHVLALYSSPSYDPNAFVGGIDRALWGALNGDEAKPLLDRAIGTRYPPASTFKLATATIAIRRGLATPGTRMPVPCTGGLQYGDRVFKCWNTRGHGYLTLEQAIATSCDVYFYQLGMRVGLRALLEDGDLLGFRSRSGVDLPGEVLPAFPQNAAYYDRVYGRGHWTSAVALNLAIGQGENAQTLMNMVRFYAALANGGRLLVPRIIDEPAPQARVIDVADSTLAAMREALIAVVEQGTARGARLASIRLAGKTGTAQNPHGPDHGWFVGFAPADNPRVVVGGILEFGLHGTAMAPIVARVIERYLLGPDSLRGSAGDAAMILPQDSAPLPQAVDTVPPAPADSARRPGPARRPARRPAPRPVAPGDGGRVGR